jgi:hypothetical protein
LPIPVSGVPTRLGVQMKLSEIVNKAFDACRGRHTFFVGAFFVMGHVAHWLHRLDGTYIGFMSSLMAFVLGRTVSGDVNPPK